MCDFRVIDRKQEVKLDIGECFYRIVAQMKTGDLKLKHEAGKSLQDLTGVVSKMIDRDHPDLKSFLLEEAELFLLEETVKWIREL